MVKYSGDGGFGFGTVMTHAGTGAGTDDFNACGGDGTATTPTRDAAGKRDPAGPETAAVAQGSQYLCATVKATNATRIEAGDYMADVSIVTASTALGNPFKPMGAEDVNVA